MNIYMTGRLVVDRPIPDEMQDHIFELLKSGAAFISSDGIELTLEDTFGDYGDNLNVVIEYLESGGLHVDPDKTAFQYYGDYDGGYLMENGRLESFGITEYVIRTTTTDALIKELRRRVSANN